MGDVHFSYASCGEEKFCKYSYLSWCPSCESVSPRRRSKSETTSECRKKCKEMKGSPLRRHGRSSEYENMDVVCEANRETYRHLRSSKLCELPTSYITNNGQTSKLSTTEYGTCEGDRNMKQEDIYEMLDYQTKSQLKESIRRRPNNYCDNRLSFDTSTYFDKVYDASSLHERYIREIEAVRRRIAAWKRCEGKGEEKELCRDSLPVQDMREGSAKARRGKTEVVKYVNCNNVRGEVGARSKKVVIKTRKLTSGKIKVRPVSARASSGLQVTEFVESDSEGEETNEDDDSENVSQAADLKEAGSSCSGSQLQPGGGDTSCWPVRPSLFPYIPPYIRFNGHDAEVPVKVPAGRRLFKWKLSTITPIVVRKTLANSGFALVRKSNQWLGTWGKHMKSPMFKTLKETQKLNHFPGTFQLGRKDRLWRNFQRFINKYGHREFGFIPQTFVLPQELKLLKQNWEYKSGGEAWIIKPPASARGVGIKVINKWSQLPKKMSLVVQRYISNPYLINESKFDLRLYVLVTSFDPLRIYLYPEGLARFASAKYSEDAKDFKDRYVHLTNYSINKLSNQYTPNEDANSCHGHKWTLSKLLEYLVKKGVDTKALWSNLQQLVIKTIITGEAPIHQLCEENMLSRYNCYELFGVDVLLDENLKPWLLEVNISPSLHSSSPLDAHVKGPLVRMLFDLAQFHFPPRLAQTVRQSPQCHEPKLYTTALTKKEREKHRLFEQYESRADYVDDILTELTGDDVRKLTQAEDELTARGRFERIFPTSQTHNYLHFMETRYYNRLFDAWESRFERNRLVGVNLLRALCAERVHLKVAPQTAVDKNSQNTSLGCVPQSSKELPDRPLVDILQEVTIGNGTSCN